MKIARRTKILAAALGLSAFTAVTQMGTFAQFTSTVSAGGTYSSGTVAIVLGNTGAATNRLTVGASGLVPGDVMQRSVDLTNNSTAGQAATLTTTASPSSKLDQDATNGLQMVIDKCSVSWTESGAAPYTYTCSGSTSAVLASRAVIGSNLTLSNLASGGGTTDHLRVTLTLPSAADNTFQNLSSTISYQFSAAQRTAGAQ
jgi:spore coat-associated protein N